MFVYCIINACLYLSKYNATQHNSHSVTLRLWVIVTKKTKKSPVSALLDISIRDSEYVHPGRNLFFSQKVCFQPPEMIPMCIRETKKHRKSFKEYLCTCGEGLRNVLSIPRNEFFTAVFLQQTRMDKLARGLSLFEPLPLEEEGEMGCIQMNPARCSRSHTQTWVGLVADVHHRWKKYICKPHYLALFYFNFFFFLSVWENDAICNQLSRVQENKSFN